jgi:hypothetical protein
MPTHYCVKTLEALLPYPSHIQEGPLQGSTYTWFTDGRSYVEGGCTESRLCYSILNPNHQGTAPPSQYHQSAG